MADDLSATPYESLECYDIPYGLLGFLSHLLTFCSIFWNAKGRSALRPWRPKSSSLVDDILHYLFDKRLGKQLGTFLGIILALAKFGYTIAISLRTIVRCDTQEPYRLLGVWKLFLSVFDGLWDFTMIYYELQETNSEGVPFRVAFGWDLMRAWFFFCKSCHFSPLQ